MKNNNDTDWVNVIKRSVIKHTFRKYGLKVCSQTKQICNCKNCEDITTILFFPTPLEVLGGKDDGLTICKKTKIDVRYITNTILSKTLSVDFIDNGDLSYVSVLGLFKKNKVEINLLNLPPSEIKPKKTINFYTGAIDNKK